MTHRSNRRFVLRATVAGAAVSIGHPALAKGLARMTEGPFYPDARLRSDWLDADADLTLVGGVRDGQAPQRAVGEHLDLTGRVVDAEGRAIDRAQVEIWQCDAFGSYRHPHGGGAQVDAGFQGFGMTSTDALGRYRFRTIRPVPYPGRAPHIHVKLRHPSFGELTSQLFVAGDAGNPRDGLYRRLSVEDRDATELRLQRAAAGAPVMWVAERELRIGS